MGGGEGNDEEEEEKIRPSLSLENAGTCSIFSRAIATRRAFLIRSANKPVDTEGEEV